MAFAAPLWLLALIPWAGVALYLLRGRRHRESVPFLGLWLGPVTGPPARRKMAAPPVAVALALLAALLALLGAAGPLLPAGGRQARVRIVLDRGASMSARGGAAPRFLETADEVATELGRDAPSATVELQAVPGGEPTRTAAAHWMAQVRRQSRTAADTATAVGAAASVAIDGADVVVVVSDHPVAESDRLLRVAPEGAARNAGIVLLSVRDTPRPQVMVRLRSGTPAGSGRVEVSTAGETTTADVQLPAGGTETRDVFIDVPRVGDVVAARLVGEDAFDADNVAWVVREGGWPRIEPRVALSPALARMVEVYAKSRPPGRAPASVAIVNDPGAVPPATPTVVVAPAGGGGTPVARPGSGTVEVSPHAVSRYLESAFRVPGLGVARPAPAGWEPVVRLNAETAVAVREQPGRQVWVGLNSPQWAQQPEYVVFWANVFDWLGGSGGAEFRASPVGPLGAGWRLVDGNDVGAEPGLWPGLYERTEDGARRAVNATDVRFPPPAAPSDWRGRLRAALAGADDRGAIGSWLLAAAVACLALAAAAWRPRRAAMS